MGRIKKLSEEVVQKIAAGEVNTRAINYKGHSITIKCCQGINRKLH
jgi:hypothetical protein